MAQLTDVPISKVLWSPVDPTRLATTSIHDDIIRLFHFDQAQGILKEEKTIATGIFFNGNTKWNLDGTLIAVSSTDLYTAIVSVWDIETGKRVNEFQTEGTSLVSLPEIEWRANHSN